MSETDLNPVSVTQGDRVLTGVGVDPERLAETMERHAPDEPVAPSEKPTPSEAQQPQSRGQKRFAQLTSERDKEKNAREAAEKERDDLRAQLARAATPQREPEGTRAADGVDARASATHQARIPEVSKETRAKPTESEVGSKYESYADFVEDLADWKAEQRLAALNFDAKIRSSIEADRASRTQADHVTKAVERGRKAFPDFDAVLQAPHMLQPWPGEKILAIAQLAEPEHIQYQLGKNPELAERLRTADPVQFGMELARLIPAPAVVTQASTAGAGTVTIPTPYQPVGAGSKSTAPPLADLPRKGGFDYDKSGYRERRAAELGRGTRRR